MGIAIIIIGLVLMFALCMAIEIWVSDSCGKCDLLCGQQSSDEQIEEKEKEGEELGSLSEEDENKIVKFALKQMKYSHEKPDLSYFHADLDRSFSSHKFRFFLQLQDVFVRIYVAGPCRWKSDTVHSMLRCCARHFYKQENPFIYVRVSLHTYNYEDEVEVTDWKTIEKFVDIMYDKVYGKNFRTFVRDIKAEEDELNKFRKQRNTELYNKIGIRGK